MFWYQNVYGSKLFGAKCLLEDSNDPQPERSRKHEGPKRLGAESSLDRQRLCNKMSGAKWFPCNETSIGRKGLVPKCLATEL